MSTVAFTFGGGVAGEQRSDPITIEADERLRVRFSQFGDFSEAYLEVQANGVDSQEPLYRSQEHKGDGPASQMFDSLIAGDVVRVVCTINPRSHDIAGIMETF